MKSFSATMIKLSIKVEIKLSTEPIGVALAGIEVQLAGLLRSVVDCLLKHTVQCSLLETLQLK